MVTPTFCEPQGVVNTSVKLPRVLLSELTTKLLPTPFVTLRLFGPLRKVTVPVGFTVKLMVPLPCFEKLNGFGLVVAWTVHGVGVTTGLGEGLAPGDGFTLGDGLAPGDGDGFSVGDGEASGDGLASGVGEGLASGEGEGVGDGCGLLLPFMVEPPSISVNPESFTFTSGTSSR
jgi:hypothetical protein